MTVPTSAAGVSMSSTSNGSCQTPSICLRMTSGFPTESFVTLATHLLDENRDVQQSASGDFEDVFSVAVVDTERDVGLEFAVEPFADVTTCDVFSGASRDGRTIDRKDHGQGRFVDLNSG